ncbi:site-2 protease family protein [Natrialbaceae archaeon A-arb3/5]
MDVSTGVVVCWEVAANRTVTSGRDGDETGENSDGDRVAMLTTLLWIGVGVLASTVVAMGLQARGSLPSWVSVSGPLITFETRNGLGVLDTLARPRYRRVWRAWTDGGVLVSLVLLVATSVLVLFAAYAALTTDAASEVNQPRNALAIPGVNDFLPLSAAPEIVFGLFVGLFVHEFGHGVLGRVEDVGVESAGLIFLTIVPFGAFVGVDEDDEDAAATRSRNRIYAAGIANNLALAFAAFVLLVALVSTSIAAVPGLAVGGVYPATPAADAGLERGDVVTAVDGEPIDGAADLHAALEAEPDRTVELAVEGDRDGTETVRLERSVVVTSTLAGGGSNDEHGTTADLQPGDAITAVNGTAVHTEREFEAALENHTNAALETDGRATTTVVAGVAVAEIDPDGPFAAAGVPTPDDDPDSVVLTHVDGERVVDEDALFAVLADATPGEDVTVEAVVDGERERYDVTLGERDGTAVLGLSPVAGTSGITVTDFGATAHPSEQHLAIMQGQPAGDGLDSSVLDRGVAVFALPFAGMIGGISTANFGGFVGSVANFYTVTGPLSVFGSGVFLAANLLFWAWWLNLLLGAFNCIPCYPLDGAKILRTTVEDVGSRLSIARPDRIGTAAMVVASVVIAGAIALVLASPVLG